MAKNINKITSKKSKHASTIKIKKPFDKIAIRGQKNSKNASKIIEIFKNAGANNHEHYYTGDNIIYIYYIKNCMINASLLKSPPKGYKKMTLKEVCRLYNKSGLNPVYKIKDKNLIEKTKISPKNIAIEKGKTNIPKITIKSKGGDHGKIIIKTLLSLGAKNPNNFTGKYNDYYFINDQGNINSTPKRKSGYKVIELPKENEVIEEDQTSNPIHKEAKDIKEKEKKIVIREVGQEVENEEEIKPIFSNPKNIGVSVIELERYLRPLNPQENTQEFINAVMKVYIKSNLQNEESSPIENETKELQAVLPNGIDLWADWQKSGKEKILQALKSTNLNTND